MRPEEDDSDKCAYDAAAADDGDGGVLMLMLLLFSSNDAAGMTTRSFPICSCIAFLEVFTLPSPASELPPCRRADASRSRGIACEAKGSREAFWCVLLGNGNDSRASIASRTSFSCCAQRCCVVQDPVSKTHKSNLSSCRCHKNNPRFHDLRSLSENISRQRRLERNK